MIEPRLENLLADCDAMGLWLGGPEVLEAEAWLILGDEVTGPGIKAMDQLQYLLDTALLIGTNEVPPVTSADIGAVRTHADAVKLLNRIRKWARVQAGYPNDERGESGILFSPSEE